MLRRSWAAIDGNFWTCGDIFPGATQSHGAGWFLNAQRFLGYGGGCLEGIGMHGAGAGIHSAYEFLNVAVPGCSAWKHGCIFFSLAHVRLGIIFVIYFYALPPAACLQWYRNNYDDYRNTASAAGCIAYNINLNVFANYISFLGQRCIKECASNGLTELIYWGCELMSEFHIWVVEITLKCEWQQMLPGLNGYLWGHCLIQPYSENHLQPWGHIVIVQPFIALLVTGSWHNFTDQFHSLINHSISSQHRINIVLKPVSNTKDAC